MSTMTREQVESAVQAALRDLREHDSHLLEFDVAERSITARLAHYMIPLFEDYAVDVEYNRHGIDPKKMAEHVATTCQQCRDRLVVPDIIVHRRGDNERNLLVVELKKSTNSKTRTLDRNKLKAYKHELNYKFGALITVPAGRDWTSRPHSVELD